jgi:hypothetical protein
MDRDDHDRFEREVMLELYEQEQLDSRLQKFYDEVNQKIDQLNQDEKNQNIQVD